jgi:DNA polymerase (family 10)
VIASVHSAFNMDEAQMTERVLRAIANPHVDVLGHPTGRLILKRDGYKLAFEKVVDAAARTGVALEINSQVDRLDLSDVHARMAREHGVRIIIDSDAHSPAGLAALRFGAVTARRAWLEAGDVLNTAPLEAFKASLRRSRN